MVLATLLLPLLAIPTVAPAPFIATATEATPEIDGLVDDAVWAAAPPFTSFVESAPEPGATPTEDTEVRILYDRRDLYVSVICRHRDPAAIVATLGPRDRPPASDKVTIGIDADRDRRSALTFTVTAAGVLEDSLLYEDHNEAISWDAVWDGAAARRPDGWSAEWRIPLRLLRPGHASAAVPVFGFVVRRFVADGHRAIDSALIPREGNAVVSRFGDLTELKVASRHDVELAPYVAGGTTWDGAAASELTVGVDARATLGGGITVAAAINPDFGQVEADDRVANFGTDEMSFPEKRPFFNDGLELFQPVGAAIALVPQRLFYSRRIGLDRPILGAVKLTSAIADGVDAGAFAAVVSDHRPLAMGGPGGELADDVTAGYATAALRLALAPTAHVGTMMTAAMPLAVSCASAECRPVGAVTGGVDWDVQSADGVWGVIGQLDGSAITDGPSGGRVLRDGTRIETGDVGAGTYVQAGKLGGAPWRFDVRYAGMSPRLDLNVMGFQPVQRQQQLRVGVAYARPDGVGDLLSLEVGVRNKINTTADARRDVVGIFHLAYADVTLPSFVHLQCNTGALHHYQDRREIAEAGVIVERPRFGWLECSGETDATRALSASAWIYAARSGSAANNPAHYGLAGGGGVTWRPAAALETSLTAASDTYIDGPRWLDTEGEVVRFAVMSPRSLALTLRQQVVFTPALALLGRATLYTEVQRFGQLFRAELDGPTLALADLERTSGVEPTRHAAALDMQLSLRWDYRPGGALFVTYARGQEEAAPPDRPAADDVGVGELFAAPARHQVLVKVSYFWGT